MPRPIPGFPAQQALIGCAGRIEIIPWAGRDCLAISVIDITPVVREADLRARHQHVGTGRGHFCREQRPPLAIDQDIAVFERAIADLPAIKVQHEDEKRGQVSTQIDMDPAGALVAPVIARAPAFVDAFNAIDRVGLVAQPQLPGDAPLALQMAIVPAAIAIDLAVEGLRNLLWISRIGGLADRRIIQLQRTIAITRLIAPFMLALGMRLERQAIGKREIGEVGGAAHMHLRVVVMQLPGVHAHPLVDFDRAVADTQIGPGEDIDIAADRAFRHRKDQESRFRPRIIGGVPFVKLVIIGNDHWCHAIGLESVKSGPGHLGDPVAAKLMLLHRKFVYK